MTAKDREKTENEAIQYYSHNRIRVISKFATVVLAVIVLMAPVVTMFLYPMSKEWMAVISFLFALCFSTVVSIFTDAQRQEVFLGTAA
jgi:cytochrome c-type biogenesis protein CcmH/NrfG